MNKDKIENLSLDEKIALLSGTDYMLTNPISRLEIPSVIHSDGPHGIRKNLSGGTQLNSAIPSTAFPPAATSASSFNEKNLYDLGVALGKEARANDIDVVLGPALNIKRNPLCGRNFEYFSEDPYLSGVMATSEVLGIQENASACIKHFACNNNENYRICGDSVVDERALREIYLKGFEMVIKNADPASIMCAYNKLNGFYCSENPSLLTKILRKIWKYDGVVLSDWGATHDRVLALKAGLDIDMPGDQAKNRKDLYDAFKNGTLDEQTIDDSVKRILKYIDRTHKEDKVEYDKQEHNLLALKIAEDSAVLLKNKNKFFPLLKEEKILILGEMFENMRYQGAGSSVITPTILTQPIKAFDDHKADYVYAKGYTLSRGKEDEKLLSEALSKAEDFEKILVFAGLDENLELEGKDRETLNLPENQLRLINELLSLGKKVGVVLFGGSVVDLPFSDQVNSILMMYLPGQCGGEACFDLIYGEKSPSGHLAESWPSTYSDVPFGENFGKSARELYKESVFVGYRYYSTAKVRTLYPFGYGLSYAEFSKRMVLIEDKKNEYVVNVKVENISRVPGSEVIQIYVENPRNNIFRPLRELRAFKKVYLMPGETQQVSLIIKKHDLKYYDVRTKEFVMDGGTYKIQLCSDCLTVIQEVKIDIELPINSSPYSVFVNEIYTNLKFDVISDSLFEDICRKPLPKEVSSHSITMETRICDYKGHLFGRMMYRILKSQLVSMRKKVEKIKDPEKRERELKSALYNEKIFEYNSMRALTMMSPKQIPYNVAEGIVDMANGKIVTGISKMMKKIEAPLLPKEKDSSKKKK